jgi:hypothetical protein
MSSEKIVDTREKFKESLLIVQNILEAEKIQRFKFTPKEISTLTFITDLLKANLKELESL